MEGTHNSVLKNLLTPEKKINTKFHVCCNGIGFLCNKSKGSHSKEVNIVTIRLFNLKKHKAFGLTYDSTEVKVVITIF